MPLIKLVVELVPRCLHSIENVEAPVYGVELVSVLIRTHVAHTGLAAHAVLQGTHMRKLVLIMNIASRYSGGLLRGL